MTDRLLTDAEIETLTGRRQAAAQIRFLQRRQIHHIVNAAGRPVVALTAIERSEKAVDDERQLVRHADPRKLLSLNDLRLLPRADAGGGCGVYFIWRHGRLLYVGETSNWAMRSYGHRERFGLFDATMIEEPAQPVPYLHDKAWRERLEARYIERYDPPLNVSRFGNASGKYRRGSPA